MKTSLSGVELLDVWERGRLLPNVERALYLLRAAYPDQSFADLASLSMGWRDTLLLELRQALCGSDVACESVCPACAERLEFSFLLSDVTVPKASNDNASFPICTPEFEGRFRLPTSADLIPLVDHTPEAARAELVSKCLVSVQSELPEISAEALSAKIIDRVSKEMNEADPQADVLISLTCPACSHTWQGIFDIASFLWREIDTWARRTMQEVHWLASAYGWTERAILSMSPVRRRTYIQMLGE